MKARENRTDGMSRPSRWHIVSHHNLYILCIYPVIFITIFLLSIYIQTKKRDRNLAVPHSEALVLPSNPNNNTEAHAVCANARIMRVHYLHTNGHLVLQCFGLYEFTRFRNAKTKRVRRLFQYVLYLPPSRKTYPLGVS